MDHVDNISGLCKGIYWIASDAIVNRKRCRDLADKVKSMEKLVEAIKRKGPSCITSDVERALWKLCSTLTAAHDLVKKCAKTKLLNPLKCRSDFDNVADGLRDVYHILAAAVPSSGGGARPRVQQQDDSDDDVRRMSGASSSSHYAASASKHQPATAMFSAAVEVDDTSVYYTEQYFLSK